MNSRAQREGSNTVSPCRPLGAKDSASVGKVTRVAALPVAQVKAELGHKAGKQHFRASADSARVMRQSVAGLSYKSQGGASFKCLQPSACTFQNGGTARAPLLLL